MSKVRWKGSMTKHEEFRLQPLQKLNLKVEALKTKPKKQEKILPFVTEFNPVIPNIKQILSKNWNSIENQRYLKTIFPQKLIISYNRAHSLKNMFVKAKL